MWLGAKTDDCQSLGLGLNIFAFFPIHESKTFLNRRIGTLAVEKASLNCLCQPASLVLDCRCHGLQITCTNNAVKAWAGSLHWSRRCQPRSTDDDLAGYVNASGLGIPCLFLLTAPETNLAPDNTGRQSLSVRMFRLSGFRLQLALGLQQF
jgi:hypothetical protein